MNKIAQLLCGAQRNLVGGRIENLAMGPLDEDVGLPTINFINNGFADKLVVANLGENDGPDNPVDTTGKDDSKANNTVNPVRKILVDVLAILRGDEGGDDEVDVAEHEEDDNRHAGRQRGVPVPLGAVDVDMEEAGGDKGVDNSQRI